MAQASGAGAGGVADLADKAGEYPPGSGDRRDLREGAGVYGRGLEEFGEAGAFGLAPAGADASRVTQQSVAPLADQDGTGQAGQPSAPGCPPADHDVGDPVDLDLHPGFRACPGLVP